MDKKLKKIEDTRSSSEAIRELVNNTKKKNRVSIELAQLILKKLKNS